MRKNILTRALCVALAYATMLSAFAPTARAAAALTYAAPIASNFSATVPANRQSIVQLQGSDSDGTALTFAVVAGPSHGTLSGLNASTGSVVYTPVSGYTGADSFTFNVTSGGDTSSTATATLTVSNQKTTISDFIVNASGAGRSGKVTFILTQPVTTPSGIAPTGTSVSASLGTNGAFTIQIYPSRSLNPAAYYQVWWTDGSQQELIGVYDIPLSTTTVALAPYKVTDANLAARYTFASAAGLSALVTAVSNSAVALLLSESRTTGKLQYWDGDNFTDSIVSQSGSTVTVAGTVAASGYSGIQAANIPSAVDAAKLANGSVSNTEFQYLDGVTSAVQTQLNAKAASTHAHAASDVTSGTLDQARIPSIDLGTKSTGTLPNARTTATSSNTPSTIVSRDASGNFSAGTVTATNFIGNGTGIAFPGGTSVGHDSAGNLTFRFDSGNAGGGLHLDEMTGPDVSRRVNNDGTQQFFYNVTGVSATLPDKGAAVFNVKAYGAVPDDGVDDRTAIQAAITAAETAGGGTVYVPPGTYHVAGTSSDAQLILIQKSIGLICAPASRLLMSVPGADTTRGVAVKPAAIGSWNVLSHLKVEDCTLEPVAGSEPGGEGLVFDTSASQTQIRNAVVKGNHIGTPTAEFGSYALKLTMATGAADTQFTNHFERNWAYGGVDIDKVGDTLTFFKNTITSNVVDRPSARINIISGTTGPVWTANSMTAGGGVVILSSSGGMVFRDNIIEIANTSLTTAAVTPAIVQVKGGGVVTTVRGVSFRDNLFISHIDGVHGIIAHQSDKLDVGTNYFALAAAGIAGNDPVYGLSRSTLYWVTTTATATNTNAYLNQTAGPDNLGTSFYSANDATFSFIPRAFANSTEFFNQGNFSMLGYLTSSSGFSFGTNLPYWSQGTTTPEGSVFARNGSIYSNRSGGAGTSLYVKTTGVGFNTGWVALGTVVDPGSNGLMARTAANTTTARTITGTSGEVTVTNGTGVSGNPTISLDAPPAFTAPTLLNSYANAGGGTANAGYLKHHGFVVLRGTIGTGTAPGTAFTLPAGYRPSASLFFAVQSGGSFRYVTVEADGDVVISGYTGSVSLDGIRFIAEQ